jgi:hypothetical protein
MRNVYNVRKNDGENASLSSTTTSTTCEPCWSYDPRRECNSKTCTSCIDLLLLSIHRSGRRPQDPPLPIDELSRECSLNDDAYYYAEHYFFVGKENDSTSSLAVVPPLNTFKIQMIL